MLRLGSFWLVLPLNMADQVLENRAVAFFRKNLP